MEEAEDDLFFSGEEGEFNMRLRIMRAARSCKDSYTKKSSVRWSDVSFLLGCDLSLSGLSGSLCLELSLWQTSPAVF